jgi:hypothetical protein
MIFLIDEMPRHCPSCGKEHKTDSWASSDFHAGASSQCKCGVMWQYVPTAQLVEASKLNQQGDLHRYA